MALALRVSGNRGRAGQRRAGERRELSFQYGPRRPKVKNDREGRLVRDSPHPSRGACLVRDYRPEPHSDRLGRTPMEAGVSGPLFALGALSLCRREEKEGDRGRNRVRVACTLTLIFSTHFSHASWTSLSPQALPLDSSSVSWAKSSRRATTSCSSGDRGRSRERERERERERGRASADATGREVGGLGTGTYRLRGAELFGSVFRRHLLRVHLHRTPVHSMCVRVC